MKALLLLAVIGVGARAAAEPSPAPVVETKRPPSPYRLNLAVDLSLTVVDTAIWILPWALTTKEQPAPPCDPCNPSNVNAFDRLAIGLHYQGARTGANALLGVMPVFIFIAWGDYGIRDWRGWGTDVLVIGESIVMSGALDEIVRRAVRRPRPYMYEAGVYPELRTTAEGSLSFFSGHTAALFALAVSTSYTFQLRHPHSKWVAPLWVGLLAVATAEGVLRVVAGDHFPTDVLVGAVVGTASGFTVTALHRRKLQLQVVPSVSSTQATVTLNARF